MIANSVQSADAKIAEQMQRGLTRDILLCDRPWRPCSPWDQFGALNSYQPVASDADMGDTLALRRAYYRMHRLVDGALASAGVNCRRRTRWRMASALVDEATTAPENGGAWTATQRADACGIHHTDFKRRVLGVYESVLWLVNESLREARRGAYEKPRR